MSNCVCKCRKSLEARKYECFLGLDPYRFALLQFTTSLFGPFSLMPPPTDDFLKDALLISVIPWIIKEMDRKLADVT
jgi:hypothetical protein